ncbi:MAG: septal ring lytic transglycosylase RlpA family protein [Magnetovibrio sp.]|nr:septal ring lytic transglycosylase RlpA family protein [Magnetovibrio sp.]
MATAKKLGKTTEQKSTYKVGKPYQVKGVWYYPAEDWTYDRTGIASWYGPNFHGKPTANGEIFNQWEVSAAHKTLPLPSIVRVTNLGNGRSLVVRINDRGPFKPGRIIDMSKQAAQLLGFEGQGTAQVRVQVLTQQSLNLAQRAQPPRQQLSQADSPIKVNVSSISSQPVVSQSLPPVVSNQPLPAEIPQEIKNPIGQQPVLLTRMYVQAGAFGNRANAERVKSALSSVGNIVVSSIPVNGRNLYRVRVGPVSSVMEVDRLLSDVINAGFAGARTIIETGQGVK